MSKDMTLKEWADTYKPMKNDIEPERGWNETLHETYGKELDKVRLYEPLNRVWTWVDGDNGTYLVSGMSFVNRIGYFITEEPYEDTLRDFSNYLCITVESWNTCVECDGDAVIPDTDDPCPACDGLGTTDHEWND